MEFGFILFFGLVLVFVWTEGYKSLKSNMVVALWIGVVVLAWFKYKIIMD